MKIHSVSSLPHRSCGKVSISLKWMMVFVLKHAAHGSISLHQLNPPSFVCALKLICLAASTKHLLRPSTTSYSNHTTGEKKMFQEPQCRENNSATYFLDYTPDPTPTTDDAIALPIRTCLWINQDLPRDVITQIYSNHSSITWEGGRQKERHLFR